MCACVGGCVCVCVCVCMRVPHPRVQCVKCFPLCVCVDILRQKKQLQNENIELLATVEDLKAKLAELDHVSGVVGSACVIQSIHCIVLQEVLSQEVATQVSPSPTDESAVQTDPTQDTSLYQPSSPQAQDTSLYQQASPQAQEFLHVHETLQLEFPVPKATLSRSTLTQHSIEAVDFDPRQTLVEEQDTSHMTLVRTRMEELAGHCGQLEMR